MYIFHLAGDCFRTVSLSPSAQGPRQLTIDYSRGGLCPRLNQTNIKGKLKFFVFQDKVLLLEINKGMGCYQYAGSHVVTMRQGRLREKPAPKGGRRPKESEKWSWVSVSCLEAGPTPGLPIL